MDDYLKLPPTKKRNIQRHVRSTRIKHAKNKKQNNKKKE
jgi:hypothetical protein